MPGRFEDAGWAGRVSRQQQLKRVEQCYQLYPDVVFKMDDYLIQETQETTLKITKLRYKRSWVFDQLLRMACLLYIPRENKSRCYYAQTNFLIECPNCSSSPVFFFASASEMMSPFSITPASSGFVPASRG